ncbi:DUF4340 domain-containing protein [Herbivorax sp. ANBcel31]|uniref:DUF4340 domain-containing protein n=1 Tax=Herbivorax sp. ANBcel31 TaxID=3069754 RepID=UPI0027B44E73|nr:DUF4340 domain-containing protein [Herbivorax sp. ANBcel31]MDQ2086700.1 DUF4340 domain-containing protein [Herbivorax sp. ANBcel31]
MRFYKYAIILVVVVAILTGIYFIVDRTVEPEEDIVAESIELLEIDDEEEVQSLTVKNNEGEFVFERDGNSWNLISGGEFEADSLRLNNIVSSITELHAERIIEENTEDFERYGLLEALVLTVETVDGDSSVLELGSATATHESYYMRLNASDTVYTIPYDVGSVFNVTKTDIRDRYVINCRRADVIEFGLERDGKTVFMAEREGERDWNIVDPFEVSGNIVDISDAMDSFIRTHAIEYVEEDASDLSTYGLDNPRYAVEAKTNEGQSFKLLIGDEKGMNFETYIKEIYALLEGSNEVFLIDIGPLNFLEKSLIDFVNRFVYVEDMRYMEGAYVEIDDEEINLKIERITDDEGRERLNYYVNEKEVYEDGHWNFRELYRTLMAVGVKEIDIEAEPPEEQPEALMTFYLNKDPEEVTIEFIPRDDTSYYALRNGEYTGLIAEQESFDIISETYDILLDDLKD